MMKRTGRKKLLISAILLSLGLLFIHKIDTFAAYDLDWARAVEPDWVNETTGYGVYIADHAGYLSESQEKSLIEDMKPVTEYGTAIFWSEKEQIGELSRYAELTFLTMIGPFRSGVIFATDYDEIYLYSGGEMYDVLGKSYAYTITDNVYQTAIDGDWYGCVSAAFEMITDVLEGRRIAQPMKYICNFLLALMAALLLNYWIMNRVSGLKKVTGLDLIAESTALIETSNKQVNLTERNSVYIGDSGGGSSGGGYHGGGYHGGGRSGGGFHGGGGHHGGGGGHRIR